MNLLNPTVTKHSFTLPETIGENAFEGSEYEKHLFVNDENGIFRATLNTWEDGVLVE